MGWGRANPAFRHVFSELFVPRGTAEQPKWFDELARTATSPEMAERPEGAWYQIEVTALLPQAAVPTLVAHGRGDAMIPFAEGRLLATSIPGALFLPLESENHILLADEPAWPVFLAGIREFLGSDLAPDGELSELSPREIDVLELVATGLNNGDRRAPLPQRPNGRAPPVEHLTEFGSPRHSPLACCKLPSQPATAPREGALEPRPADAGIAAVRRNHEGPVPGSRSSGHIRRRLAA